MSTTNNATNNATPLTNKMCERGLRDYGTTRVLMSAMSVYGFGRACFCGTSPRSIPPRWDWLPHKLSYLPSLLNPHSSRALYAILNLTSSNSPTSTPPPSLMWVELHVLLYIPAQKWMPHHASRRCVLHSINRIPTSYPSTTLLGMFHCPPGYPLCQNTEIARHWTWTPILQTVQQIVFGQHDSTTYSRPNSDHIHHRKSFLGLLSNGDCLHSIDLPSLFLLQQTD